MALIEYNPPLEPYLEIIYQDNHLCVVNKPSGLLSVPGNQPQYYDSARSRVKETFGFCAPAHRLVMAANVNRKNIIKRLFGGIWRKIMAR